MKILLSFISHDAYHDLVELIDSLDSSIKGITGNELQISLVIVENSFKRYTNDQILSITSSYIPTRIDYIANRGYNHALNYSWNVAKSENCDYLVAGNTDIVFSSDYFSHLTTYLKDNNFYIAVPSVLNLPSLRPQNPRMVRFSYSYWSRKMSLYFSCPIFFYLSNLKTILKDRLYSSYRLLFGIRPLQVSSSRTTLNLPTVFDIPCGVQFIFNLHNLPSSFSFDENVFLWGEELLLYIYLQRFGWKFTFFQELIIHHKPSSSVSRLALKYYYIQRQSFDYIQSLFN